MGLRENLEPAMHEHPDRRDDDTTDDAPPLPVARAPPRAGRVLAEQDDEQGIRRQVLPPGAYRLNPYGFSVELVDATEIKPGYVGVLRRRLGRESRGRFADQPEEKGILRQVLQPGLY